MVALISFACIIFPSLLGYPVLKCQGFLLIALSGQEEHMHIYTQTRLGKDFRQNH